MLETLQNILQIFIATERNVLVFNPNFHVTGQHIYHTVL